MLIPRRKARGPRPGVNTLRVPGVNALHVSGVNTLRVPGVNTFHVSGVNTLRMPSVNTLQMTSLSSGLLVCFNTDGKQVPRE